jgi:hypothetical protein
MYYTEQVTSLMCAFLKSIYTDKTNLEFTTFINAPVIAKRRDTVFNVQNKNQFALSQASIQSL